MAADDVDVDAKEVGQLASEPGEVEKRGISWYIYKEVNIRARVSVSSGDRPEDTYVRDPVPIGQRLNVVLPGLDHLTESRTLDGSFSRRPLHVAQDTPPTGQALGWWPRQSVCQRSANGLPPIGSGPFVCDSLFGSGSATDAGSALSRTPSPVARSTTVPAGGDRGAQQFPLMTCCSRMRIGRGLHPIQVRPSRNDDVELDVLER